jgi:DNA-binding response OmpR family regulator
MSKILLLEDDDILSSTMVKLLELEGFDVTLATNGKEVLDLTYENNYDLYLFDINVPFISGLDILDELRQSGDTTAAFFITALIDINSISKGFEIGVDDYIKKPFEMDELIIRIKSVLKKHYNTLSYKDLQYDPISKSIKKNNTYINLGNIEISIFDLLLKNINKNVLKEQFFDLMDNPTDVALRVHISRLKKELDLDIKNIRGVGYRLEEI